MPIHLSRFFFFFNDTATTEIYTLSLHDALPISARPRPESRAAVGIQGPSARTGPPRGPQPGGAGVGAARGGSGAGDRKSTRLNSSHGYISYAVFCLKKKKNTNRF